MRTDKEMIEFLDKMTDILEVNNVTVLEALALIVGLTNAAFISINDKEIRKKAHEDLIELINKSFKDSMEV
jgi:hypothetical protein